MKNFFVVIIAFLLFINIPLPVHAQGEFSSKYNVTYAVEPTGETIVTEKVTLKNLTDTYYASSFTLTIGATDIREVSASDAGGPLETQITNVDNKTEIKVVFNQQVTGKDKEYPWSLSFKSKDFAQQQGKIWQVSVPKIQSADETSQYEVSLVVPAAFGDPTTILPEPKSKKVTPGTMTFAFDKDQLDSSGVIANFGDNQYFDFTMNYHLDNTSNLPSLAQVPLPPDTAYQQIVVNAITPQPENVITDDDGNYLAVFKLNTLEKLQVTIKGTAKLYLNAITDSKKQLTQGQFNAYTKPQPYWDSDNALINAKVAEIFKDKNPNTNEQKAKLLYDFVVNHLKYNQARVENTDFERLGATVALNNPNNALCSEFTDLFIALARAADIPARSLVGYAYTANQDIRPLSFQKKVLHAWPEYYDSELGWVMVDPTWENTTGGVDYFNKLDLNHFVLAIHGTSSDEPGITDDMEIKFSDSEFLPAALLAVDFEGSETIFGGIPYDFTVKVHNNGNTMLQPDKMLVSASRIDMKLKGTKELSKSLEFYPGVIPPFGHIDYQLTVVTQLFSSEMQDNLLVKIGPNEFTKQLSVQPFYSYKLFPLGVSIASSIMLGMYLISFAMFKNKHGLERKAASA